MADGRKLWRGWIGGASRATFEDCGIRILADDANGCFTCEMDEVTLDFIGTWFWGTWVWGLRPVDAAVN
jgi:hypothetical protein